MSDIQNLLAQKGFGFGLSILNGNDKLPIIANEVVNIFTENGSATVLVKGASAIYTMPFDVFQKNTLAIQDEENVGNSLSFYKQKDGTFFLVQSEDFDNTYENDGSDNFVFDERQLPDTIKLNNVATQYILTQSGSTTFKLKMLSNTSKGIKLGSLTSEGYNIVFGTPANLHIIYKTLGRVKKSDVLILEKIVSNPNDLIRDFQNRNKIIEGQHFYKKRF